MVAWYWLIIEAVAVIAGLCLFLLLDSSDAEEARMFRRQYEELRKWRAEKLPESILSLIEARHDRERKELGL